MKLTEFYTEKQGRPTSDIAIDIDKGTPTVALNNIRFIRGEIVELQNALATVMNDQVVLLEKIRIEMVQAKLHLASLSNEPIDEESARE